MKTDVFMAFLSFILSGPFCEIFLRKKMNLFIEFALNLLINLPKLNALLSIKRKMTFKSCKLISN
jgi:hypothetical protein